MHVVDYMNMTVPLDWAHLGHERSFKSALDCLHYCRPGIPEVSHNLAQGAQGSHAVW
jgi:hypothetical protein